MPHITQVRRTPHLARRSDLRPGRSDGGCGREWTEEHDTPSGAQMTVVAAPRMPPPHARCLARGVVTIDLELAVLVLRHHRNRQVIELPLVLDACERTHPRPGGFSRRDPRGERGGRRTSWRRRPVHGSSRRHGRHRHRNRLHRGLRARVLGITDRRGPRGFAAIARQRRVTGRKRRS